MSERKLDEDEVRQYLAAELPYWSLGQQGIERSYRADGFRGALLAANAVGHLAEAAWHHPDLQISWGRLGVRLYTHSAKGITDKDLALAKRIEALLTWRPTAADGPLEGTPDDPRYRYLVYD
jgi:4a-hydroxytetrahydrobiopterin dehydratase